MRLDVRVPVTATAGSVLAPGISTRLAPTEVTFEALMTPTVGSGLRLEVSLLGSGRTIDLLGRVTESLPLAGRRERLITAALHFGDEEVGRAWNAWLSQRAALVMRAPAREDVAAQQVRGAVFEVSPDGSQAKVGWPTRMAFAKTWREELVDKRIEIRARVPSGAAGRRMQMVFLIPQAPSILLDGQVTMTQAGDAIVELDIPADIALRLAVLARV